MENNDLDKAPALTVISLGAGVQSTALALMACDGVLPRPDAAIFADTGWEPRRVYEHLELLADELDKAGIALYRVSVGNLREDSLDPQHRYCSVPYFVRNPDGSGGMGRRQCTSEYKLRPIKAKVRELLGYPHPKRVPRGVFAEQWIGFSTDEIGRVRDKLDVQYARPRHPLLELGMSRRDCERWLRTRGWSSVAKSACIGCPFHGNRQWRELRDTCVCGHTRTYHRTGQCSGAVDTAAVDESAQCDCMEFRNPEWQDAVAFDRAIRQGGARGLPAGGEAFLHRSMIPLDLAPIDRVTRKEWADRQLDVFDALADGDDFDENGDPEGCSPYGCRSGVVEPRDSAGSKAE
ncbi:hypothetical protein [Saccharopolyspora griseoalba]|uniref:Phosphoadenosine phosphosulphate reductase domain-containing protein n=1 Tax=Saccharopolyspora griseoalba TaxID=1431848 RepID=A0ABW2LQX3_9PSEU